MKCLWRIVRNLNEWINTVNISTILVDLHKFLKVSFVPVNKRHLFFLLLLNVVVEIGIFATQAYPSSVWKDRQSDTPIRTIKTIIHALARLQGEAILSHLDSIDNLKDSELEPYLQKLLKNGVSKERDSQIPSANEKKDASLRPRRLSKATQEVLTAIFRKIGSKEQSQEVVVYCNVERHVCYRVFFLCSGPRTTVRFQATLSGC